MICKLLTLISDLKEAAMQAFVTKCQPIQYKVLVNVVFVVGV